MIRTDSSRGRRRAQWRARWRAGGTAVAVGLAGLLALTPTAAQSAPQAARADLLPIVFVHGNSGSAAQFQSQFQRFASNGYPQQLLFAYDWDTSVAGPAYDAAGVAGLDPFIDDVLARTGASQVLLVAHSRGTGISQAYLSTPARAAEVAKYVNLDGRSAAALPGGVPTLAIWGEWQSPPTPRRGAVGSIVGATNLYNPDLGHTEAVSAERTFRAVFSFFTGEQPRTTDVIAEPPGQVTVAGRAVLFPQNQGFAGTRLELWRIDPDTGRRVSDEPVAAFPIDSTGAFGPVKVNGRHTYEFALHRPDGSVHHFYSSPFVRDDHFLRLNSGLPGEGLERFTATSPDHTNVALIRAREIWGDQGADSDSITVDALGDAVPPLEVITPATAPRSSPFPSVPGRAVGEVNALFLTDVGTRTATGYTAPDQTTDLAKGDLFPFNTLTFLNAADVYLPASEGGTVRITVDPRGGGATEVLNVPAFRSTTDRVSVVLRDSSQASYGFPNRG